MSTIKKVDEYILKNRIGKGSFGEVYYTEKQGSNLPYATKKMSREKVEEPNYLKYFINEITILKGLFHKNIVRIECLKKTSHNYYIIMEYYDGGTLKQNFVKYKYQHEKPFNEKIVQHIMRQLVDTVNFLHSKQIVHRDLKLENILLNYNTKEAKDNIDVLHSELKLIDFGTATHISNEGLITTAIGSPLNMDPIILKKYMNTSNDLIPYDEKIDIWSLGIMCYYLLTGEYPFKAGALPDLLNEIEKGFIKIPISLSAEAVSFLLNILEYSSQKRFTAQQLSIHPFLTKYIGDFTPIDLKSVSNYIQNENLCINIKNNDEIKSIINNCINPNNSSKNLFSIKNNSNTFYSSNLSGGFGGSAPLHKINNNINFQLEQNYNNTVVPNPKINELILGIMNDPVIKNQKNLQDSLLFIYGNNNRNQSCPENIFSKNINPEQPQHPNMFTNKTCFTPTKEIKSIQDMSYANNNNNNQYHHSISAKMCSNLPKENFNGNIRGGSAKNVNETPKSFNLLGNKEGYMSNKYNSFQPQNLNYNRSYQQNYVGEIRNTMMFNNNNSNYQFFQPSFNNYSLQPSHLNNNINFK